jgi:Fur family transcriptional regulator, ferric uptake regulator
LQLDRIWQRLRNTGPRRARGRLATVAGDGRTVRGTVAALTLDELIDGLRRRGVRITAPRRAVLEALVALGSHVTAEALHEHVARRDPGISTSSVYRTMDLLAEHGVVHHVHLGHGPAEYHLVDEQHAHLVCDRCGAVVELGPDLFRPLATAVDERHGFDLDLRHFALVGRCARCRPEGTRT